MNQTIAISAFAGMLARQSGYTADFCERFVHEMFKTVADALKETTNVIINGLGTFTVTPEGNVTFTPDTTFAADINAPFDCFEPESLDDDITEDQLLNGVTDKTALPQPTDDSDSIEIADEPTTAKEIVNETPIADAEEAQIYAPQAPEITNTPTGDVTEPNEHEATSTIAEETLEDNEPNKDKIVASEELPAENMIINAPRHRPVWVFLAGAIIGAIAGAGATYFILSPSSNNAPAIASTTAINEAVIATPTANDSIVEPTDTVTTTAPTATTTQIGNYDSTADTEVYDTVTSTLAQLSRKHYGSYEFWVYIYEENKDVISNPDLVEPNTRVRIPRPEKYGINRDDRSSINNALKKAQEIASQRKK